MFNLVYNIYTYIYRYRYNHSALIFHCNTNLLHAIWYVVASPSFHVHIEVKFAFKFRIVACRSNNFLLSCFTATTNSTWCMCLQSHSWVIIVFKFNHCIQTKQHTPTHHAKYLSQQHCIAETLKVSWQTLMSCLCFIIMNAEIQRLIYLNLKLPPFTTLYWSCACNFNIVYI